jgi:hypothetical protein
LIQKSIRPDSIVAYSYSTASARRLLQQNRPIAAHSKVSTLRQLSDAKRKYGIVMPTPAICIADEQMIVNHRARVWVDPSRHPRC